MQNKMEEVAKLLGVKLGKPFEIEGDSYNPYILNNIGLFDRHGASSSVMLAQLLRGKCTIKKMPFKPEYMETYYYVDEHGMVWEEYWEYDVIDYNFFNTNNCFRTKEEITDEDIKRIVKEIKGKYNV